jgi:hypothetical protein
MRSAPALSQGTLTAGGRRAVNPHVSDDLRSALKEREQRQALEAEARVEGKSLSANWSHELTEERGILLNLSLERAKEIERTTSANLRGFIAREHHPIQRTCPDDRGPPVTCVL